MSEKLRDAKKTLGRLYARVERPTKTESRMYEDAKAALQEAIDSNAKPEPTTAEAVEEQKNRGPIDPEWTVEEVKRQVRDGNITLDEAVQAEMNGKNRKTLMDWFEEQLQDEEDEE